MVESAATGMRMRLMVLERVLRGLKELS